MSFFQYAFGFITGLITTSICLQSYKKRNPILVKPVAWNKYDEIFDIDYFKQIHHIVCSPLLLTIFKCEGEHFRLPETSFIFLVRQNKISKQKFLYFIDSEQDSMARFVIVYDKIYPINESECQDIFESSYRNKMSKRTQLRILSLLIQSQLFIDDCESTTTIEGKNNSSNKPVETFQGFEGHFKDFSNL